ncbi:GspS/AspS pilotin family protein [Vibrio agarivorans]|uniref:GspS/AspS pilotin family protein n=1 Tax=Vibrio agarivorans TaxID=153622 RepID=UPI0025B36CD4|nr:GspS/AspS pilotin family protein [Vibrio agarivorans]MDN3663033.1 GspS/AspS pilotin family protein [Vibrio agarivorans]
MRKALSIALMILLSGCASNDDKQKQLEMLASNRASLLSSELPIEHGPLSIMRASSSGTTIEIMIIYNDDAPGAISTQRLLNATMSHYCSDEAVRKNMDVGLTYRLKIRNSRGQLMVDQMIDETQCQ